MVSTANCIIKDNFSSCFNEMAEINIIFLCTNFNRARNPFGIERNNSKLDCGQCGDCVFVTRVSHSMDEYVKHAQSTDGWAKFDV